MSFDLSEVMDARLFNLMGFCKFPQLTRIVINHLNEGEDLIKDFTYTLQNMGTKSIDSLVINEEYDQQPMNMSYFIEGLKGILPKVSKIVYIENFKISKQEFEELLTASSNWAKLVIRYSILDLDEKLDLSHIQYSKLR